jgi:hypothetical protein
MTFSEVSKRFRELVNVPNYQIFVGSNDNQVFVCGDRVARGSSAKGGNVSN